MNLNWFQFARIGDAFQVRQAEDFASQSGTQKEVTTDTGGGLNVGYIGATDWLCYGSTNFGTGATSVMTRVASNAAVTGTIQYRLDSVSGPIVATVPVQSTGGWQTWQQGHLAERHTTGTRNLCLTFTAGGAADVVNLNWFQFSS